jgi:hypothetical protein
LGRAGPPAAAGNCRCDPINGNATNPQIERTPLVIGRKMINVDGIFD